MDDRRHETPIRSRQPRYRRGLFSGVKRGFGITGIVEEGGGVKPLTVLSLFDGMACGYEALKRAGIPVACYGASEIDPYAMKIALKNHPDIKHIGSIENWRDWGFSEGDLDLIIGGQGFSGAGAGLNFQDPRSRLYFEFEAIIKTLKPRRWLLENVRMKKQWADIITQRLIGAVKCPCCGEYNCLERID
jgi:site-specific DNA-cytosine methylase